MITTEPERTKMAESTWDGSDIGQVKAQAGETRASWLPSLQTWALIKTRDVERLVLADELKPLFGILKFGTLRGRINGRPGLIIPLGPDPVMPFRYRDLEEAEQKPLLDEVRALLIFREVLGLRSAPIYVAADEAEEARVTSIPEASWIHRRGWVTTPAVMQKYWPKGDFEQWGTRYLTKLMTSAFADQLEEIVLRVDPDLVWMQSYVLGRLAMFNVSPP